MEKVYFSLGSNLGLRRLNIRIALKNMEKAFGVKCKRCSRLIETKSWGFDGKDFINCAALFEIEDSPIEVLRKCKRIEAQMGRTDKPEFDIEGNRLYHNRKIDIDILLYGEKEINTAELSIPHPRMKEREFVMKPLNEII